MRYLSKFAALPRAALLTLAIAAALVLAPPPNGAAPVSFSYATAAAIHDALPTPSSTGENDTTDPDVVARFFWWLNACVTGQLDHIDPGCKEAAYSIAGFGYGAADLATCANRAGEAFASGKPEKALSCLGNAAGALMAYWQKREQ